MKISLPFPVNCRHSMPGKRAIANANVLFEREMELAEIGTHETTLVARAYNYARKIDIEYRLYDGSFYRPADDTGKPWPATDILRPKPGFERNYGNLLVNLDVPQTVGWQWEWSTLSLYHPANGMSHVKESSVGKLHDADADIARLTGFMKQAVEERALIIDGNVWIKVDEPHLVAHLPDRPQMETGKVLISISEQLLRPSRKSGIRRSHAYRPPSEAPCFRLDRLDDFQDYLTERRKKANLETIFEFDTQIDLISPDVLTFDDETDNLARTGDRILTLVQAELRGASLQKLQLWHNLDENVGNAFENLHSVSADTLNNAIESLSALTAISDVKQMASDAADRFAVRPMEAAYHI